jgi:CrcB protein
MSNILLVMIGGAIGSAARYLLGRAAFHVYGSGWPWGTFVANILGGFLMGLLAGWLAMRATGGEPFRLFAAVGVLGGFTTFSSFSLESMLMIERGELGSALLYVASSVVLAIAALALGLTVIRSATA